MKEAGRGARPASWRSSHLEEALAALACPHAVVLAGSVVPADGARALPGRGTPAGRGGEATATATAGLPHQAGGGRVEAERGEG